MKRKYTTLPYTEYPVAYGNFDTQRSPIDRIVLHSTEGTYASAISWFNNPKAKVSAHYIISNKGELAAMLEEYNTAYHAGNLIMNRRSVGVEHEGKGTNIRSDAQYNKSAELVADICKFYNMPCDKTHVIGHRQVIATSCPGNLDINRIITYAKRILNGASQEDNSLEECRANLKEKTDLEKYLRGEIDGKQGKIDTMEETINNINKQMRGLRADMIALGKEKKTLADELKTCQKQVKVNLKCATNLIDAEGIIKDLREDKDNWGIKEINYNKQIKTLQTRIDNIKSPIKVLLTKLLEALRK